MFSMIKRIKLRLRDIGTVKDLCEGAERIAHKGGEKLPGAEHFLLSAFDLQDGTASRVFKRAGVNAEEFSEAIKEQHLQALSYVGVDASALEDDSNQEQQVKSEQLFESKPSVQTLMKELVEVRGSEKDIPLLGLHVIEVVSARQLGIVGRALKLLGLNEQILKKAVREELESYKLSIK